MAEIKGFFFDLDGTLVDTHEANFLAYQNSVLALHNMTLDDRLRTHIKAGRTSDHFLRDLLPNASDEEIEAVKKHKKAVYPDHLHVSELNESLAHFLKQMSEHYITILVTTAKKQNAMAVLKTHGLEAYFSDMIFGEDVLRSKPDPEAYELAIRRSGLDASEVIVFEDSDIGSNAAIAAGLSVVRVKNFL